VRDVPVGVREYGGGMTAAIALVADPRGWRVAVVVPCRQLRRAVLTPEEWQTRRGAGWAPRPMPELPRARGWWR
jgi:hypothetical protein